MDGRSCVGRVTKVFGTDVVAVEDESLEIADGEFMVVIPLLVREGREIFSARVDQRTNAQPGRPVRVTVGPARFRYFDKDSGERLALGRQALESA